MGLDVRMTTTSSGFDLAQTDKLLTTTRAVRKRLDLNRPVEREVLLECLGIATQAPSGGNTQVWRFLVVDDPDVRAGLAGLYRKSFEPYIAERRAEIEAAGADPEHAIIRSSMYLAEHLHEVPVHVIPLLLSPLPNPPSVMELAGLYGSILPAVWSFQLALRSRGLGSAFTTLHLAYERQAAELLGLPDTVTQVALLPVAYTKGTEFKPGQRRSAEDVTYWNAWRQRA
jgi:nitroreductase